MVDRRARRHALARDGRYGRCPRGRHGGGRGDRGQAQGGELDVEDLGPIAATAAWLHGTAGRIAAGPGMPITAMDVAQTLPEAFVEAFA
jgi:hypothetical protein